jgi:hypothetical protein
MCHCDMGLMTGGQWLLNNRLRQQQQQQQQQQQPWERSLGNISSSDREGLKAVAAIKIRTNPFAVLSSGGAWTNIVQLTGPLIGLHLYHLFGELLPSCGGAMQRMGRLHLTKSETRFNTDKTVTYFFVVRLVLTIVIMSLSPKSHS